MSEVETLRALLLEQAEAVWDAVLVGDPAPKVKGMYERMVSPQVGDFVFVAFARLSTESRRRLGILRERRGPSDFTIETLDGETVNWENARAMRLFADGAER